MTKNAFYVNDLTGDRLDNQLAQPEILLRRIAILAIAALLAIAISALGLHLIRVSDPYVQKVLSRNGDIDRGNAIFQINCASCHGHPDIPVGPSLQHVSKRKSKIGIIHQVTSGQTPPMPKFQPSPQEMADLLSYLERL